ncbi:hypothetical protein H6P81_010384 [Aristolochia fimbriata]|uniref:procollagen-proline 4-dioxygenase n=1 Tax=Aristolochia fimbriata TaxID=158543 RepID=A0AAV7EPD0_ARIFI|nr:hypothetical protein H6P81_010384 [Aristolochia fimbriata]
MGFHCLLSLLCLSSIIGLSYSLRLRTWLSDKHEASLENEWKFNPTRVRQLSWHPRAFLAEGFLLDEECDHLVELARGKLEKSMVADNDSGKSIMSEVRTSSGMFLNKGQDEIVSRIERRISTWTFLPVENGESIQILRYENGQKYEPHFDYFHDKANQELGGHRVATVLMYLSNVEKGGETIFPNSEVSESQLKDDMWSECAKKGYAVKPKKGDALLFFSLHPDARTDPDSLHGSCPVIEGEKWSATKWIHVRSFDSPVQHPRPANGECVDEDENCPQWAATGECEKNPLYMVGSPELAGYCRKSCKPGEKKTMRTQQPSMSVLLFFMVLFDLSEGCHPQDSLGLLGFKAKIHVDTSGRLATWLGQDCCKWQGITCSGTTGRVTHLNLPGFLSSEEFFGQTRMEGHLSSSLALVTFLHVIDLGELLGLYGFIPPDLGHGLPHLQKLSLHRNNISGPLPDSIGHLSALQELNLNDNRLSGSLPFSLGRLANLNTLNLFSNMFSGTIPTSFSSLKSLQRLDLHGNSLTGNIPDKFGLLENLEEVDLSNNRLSGKLPLSLGSLASIKVMYLDSNHLQGEIPFPSGSNQLPFLGFLRLQNNRLSGRMPSSLGNLGSLQRMYLSNNQLTGPIPSSFGNLTSATEIFLDGNRLSGRIPKTIGRLSSLMFFNAANNQIEGPLPSELSSLRNLQTLDLSFNRLNLSLVPDWFAQAPSLCRIYLAGCGIRGAVPDIFRRMKSPILELDLSMNHLTGGIPPWVGSLSQLYSLNLSSNSLNSEIPATITDLHDLGVLDLHSNKLTGPINQIFRIGSRFSEGSLTYVDLSDNEFTGGAEEMGGGVQYKVQFLKLSHNFLSGRLPISVGRMESMKELDLSFNKLQLGLPETVANMAALESLKLQYNRFTGSIPGGFLRLKKLRVLDLSHNLLVGRIPQGKPLTDFPDSSYAGNAGLCGRPLSPCKI